MAKEGPAEGQLRQGCWWTSAGAIAEEEPAAVIGGVALVLVDVEGATVVAPEAPGLEGE